jgi:cell division protein FtsW
MPPRPIQARTTRRVAPPLEHRILLTATLCLIAFGAVMVYSASSPQGAINGGFGASEFLMYLFAAGLGLVAMRLSEQYGLNWLTPEVTRFIL